MNKFVQARRFNISINEVASLVRKKPINILDAAIHSVDSSALAHEKNAYKWNPGHARVRSSDEWSGDIKAKIKQEVKQVTRRENAEGMMKKFSDFPLHRKLSKILSEQNLVYPTAIQSGMCKEWFKHQQDILIKAQTGTGKSIGYIALLYDALIKSEDRGIEHIVIVPNSILGDQLISWIRLLHGSSDFVLTAYDEVEEENEKARMIIGTGQKILTWVSGSKKDLSGLKTIVVDEADAVIRPLSRYATDKECANRVRHPMPAQLLLEQLMSSSARFLYISATLNALLKRHLKRTRIVRPGAVHVEAGDRIMDKLDQSNWECPKSISHLHLLVDGEEDCTSRAVYDVCKGEGTARGLVLLRQDCSKKALLENLKSLGLAAALLSNAKSHDQNVLIASDADIRGLDLPNLEYVVIVGLSDSLASYVHMAGRVGRMGREGRVISILSGERELMKHLALMSLLRVVPSPYWMDPRSK